MGKNSFILNKVTENCTCENIWRTQMDILYIVIPAYNEEETIHKVLDQWYPIVEKYDGGGRSWLWWMTEAGTIPMRS